MYLTLADPGSAITDAKYVASVGADAPRKPMGSGPFSFVKWVQGVEIDLAKNPAWTWGNPDVMGTAGPAKLDGLTFKYLNDPQTRTAAVEAGDVQFIDLVPFQNLGSLRTNDKLTTLGHPAARTPAGQLDEHADPAVQRPGSPPGCRVRGRPAVDHQHRLLRPRQARVRSAHPGLPGLRPGVETMYPVQPRQGEGLARWGGLGAGQDDRVCG